MKAIRNFFAATLALLVTLAGTALVFAPATFAGTAAAFSSAPAGHSTRSAIAASTRITVSPERAARRHA